MIFILGISASAGRAEIIIEAANPVKQVGSTASDVTAASRGGILSKGFGSFVGHYAKYEFTADQRIAPARIGIRYCRAKKGYGQLAVILDGKHLGDIRYDCTGGSGEAEADFRNAWLNVPEITAGKHTLKLLIVSRAGNIVTKPVAVKPLDVVGNRTDKNSVGHGKNVALYTGSPSRFFYATHELGDIFSAVDGSTMQWWPDQVVMSRTGGVIGLNVNIDEIMIDTDDASGQDKTKPKAEFEPVIEQSQVCVTENDVVISKIFLRNTTNKSVKHSIEITGDCRDSFDWRSKPGGAKVTERDGDFIVMQDKGVFPEYLPDGLAMVIGSKLKPVIAEYDKPGTYRIVYDIIVPVGKTVSHVFACAMDKSVSAAKANLEHVLNQQDLVAENRRSWKRFYENEVPDFECSDSKINEIYGFRWFLLKFSTAGGNLGLYKYPVVMEGRQAFQTYCCYSAPFMAFDMNWNVNPNVGFGHIADMCSVAYDDGRFPWYTSPRTNNVLLDHASRTGASLLPLTAWRFYQIHGRKDMIKEIYPAMKKNMQWWIADRDANGNGLFDIDNQLETGMDDLIRRWPDGTNPHERYESVDATCYAYVNLRAVAKMASLLNLKDDASYFNSYADKTAVALNNIAWDGKSELWRDRNLRTGELCDYNCIAQLYPLFAGVVGKQQLGAVRKHLLNPEEYWLPYPVPAMAKSDKEFDPAHRYWAGPSWPAATSHITEGLADTAKELDRSLLPQAAELLHRTVAMHTNPRADFYERYNPFTGQPLSSFRDYMHSWWIDIIIRHVAGLMPQDDGSLVIDPLPMGLDHYSLQRTPYRGHSVDIFWSKASGLKVLSDGKVIARDKDFMPGGKPLVIPAAKL